MAGKLPYMKVYISDAKGKHDFKDKSRTITLWLSEKKDNNGNNILTGSIDSDDRDDERWALAYRFVPKADKGPGGREIPSSPDAAYTQGMGEDSDGERTFPGEPEPDAGHPPVDDSDDLPF